MSTPRYFNYWGKAQEGEPGGWHPAVYHMLDCAAVCEVLLDEDEMMLRRLERTSQIESDKLKAVLPFLVACHDLGKFSRGFQSLRADIAETLNPSFRAGSYFLRHDTAGFLLWRELLPRLLRSRCMELVTAGEQIVDSDDAFDFLSPWLRAASGHHGQPPQPDTTPVGELFDREAVEAASEFVCELASMTGPLRFITGASGSLETLLVVSAWPVAGVAVLCDWVGSNTRYFRYRPEFVPIREYWTYARETARTALRDVELISPAARRGVTFPDLFDFHPSPLQQVADCTRVEGDDEPELFVIEDVTGTGKTEAALTLAARLMDAGKADGIYFALPTMATSNQMYDRLAHVYRTFFDADADPSLILMHSAACTDAAMRSEQTDAPETAEVHCATWLADGRKRGLLAAIGVGTVDQALLGVLPSRHNVLRLLGLHRKVLVVDEVHSYDTYMENLLAELLRFHASLGGSAILLTATLSLSARKLLCRAFAGKDVATNSSATDAAAFPLFTRLQRGVAESLPVEPAIRSRRRVDVNWLHDAASAIGAVAAAAREGKAVCWIRNSVDDAIEAASQLASSAPDLRDAIDLFHARFAFAHRLRIERRVLSRFGKNSGERERAGRIVIATQVIEQSLDLDFDVMVTDLAPVDLLIQRCGRLHRHARDARGNVTFGADQRGRPVLAVMTPAFDADPSPTWLSSAMKRTAFVYGDHVQLWRTMKVLRERQAIVTPDESRLLIESVFGPDAEVPTGLEAMTERLEGTRSANRSLARLHALKIEEGYRSDGTSWMDDHSAITRLAEPTVTFRIVVVREDGTLEPLVSEAECDELQIDRSSVDQWSLGDVSIRQAKLAGNALDVASQSIEQARQTMRDLGKWCELLPMKRRGTRLEGRGFRKTPENQVNVLYDATFGLVVEETDALQPH